MNQALEKSLIASLDQLEEGAALQRVLEQLAEDAVELRPYLETADELTMLSSQPSLAAQQQSQARFLATASALGGANASPTPTRSLLSRLFMPLASLALILLLLGFSLVAFSAAALPGDGLYSVKRGVEEVRLSLASDPEQILELSRSFQEERLREINALLREGRTAEVLFEGEIDLLGVEEWHVAGLAVQIVGDTRIEGMPQIGELARVEGRTVDGQLVGDRISVLTGGPDEEDELLPAVVPTGETPQPTATPAVTGLPPVTPTPEATREIRGGFNVLPENEGAPPTIAPTPTPFQPPADLGSNENDDAGDSAGIGANENGGDEAEDHENGPGTEDGDPGDDNGDNSGDENADDTNDSGSDENDNSGSDNGDDSDENNSGDDTNNDSDESNESNESSESSDDDNDNERRDRGADEDARHAYEGLAGASRAPVLLITI